MRINVIGYGVVGKAQCFLLRRLGHAVFIFDPYLFPSIEQPERNVDLTFICTPESAVEEAVHNLVREKVRGLYVIKSTVPIGTTKRLMEKYGVHIAHNPEFLREKHAYEDVVNPSRIVIGLCCESHGHVLRALYAPLKRPIYLTDPSTSEAVKLFSNAYLSMLITFWNEAYELSQKIGLDVSEVAKLMLEDVRISSYGTAKFGQPFGGKCLPSNLDMLITAFRNEGLNPTLFEAVREYNRKMRSDGV